MKVNGVETEIDPNRGTAPIVTDGRTLVPVRAIFEALGAEVEWIEETQTVEITYKEIVVYLTIGSSTAKVGDDENNIPEYNFNEDVWGEHKPELVDYFNKTEEVELDNDIKYYLIILEKLRKSLSPFEEIAATALFATTVVEATPFLSTERPVLLGVVYSVPESLVMP